MDDPRLHDVYAALCRQVLAGATIMTYAAIAELSGVKFSHVYGILSRLERIGVITRSRGQGSVRILQTGKSLDAALRDHREGPNLIRTDAIRTGCWYCGTRNDLGCRHNREAEGALRANDFPTSLKEIEHDDRF